MEGTNQPGQQNQKTLFGDILDFLCLVTKFFTLATWRNRKTIFINLWLVIKLLTLIMWKISWMIIIRPTWWFLKICWRYTVKAFIYIKKAIRSKTRKSKLKILVRIKTINFKSLSLRFIGRPLWWLYAHLLTWIAAGITAGCVLVIALAVYIHRHTSGWIGTNSADSFRRSVYIFLSLLVCGAIVFLAVDFFVKRSRRSNSPPLPPAAPVAGTPAAAAAAAVVNRQQPQPVAKTPGFVKFVGWLLIIILVLTVLGLIVGGIYHKDPEPTLWKFPASKGATEVTPGPTSKIGPLEESLGWRWVEVPEAGRDPKHPRLSGAVKIFDSSIPNCESYRLECGQLGDDRIMVVPDGNMSRAQSIKSNRIMEATAFQFYSCDGPETRVFVGYVLKSLPLGKQTKPMLEFLEKNP